MVLLEQELPEASRREKIDELGMRYDGMLTSTAL
jgi:hypothetical protein